MDRIVLILDINIITELGLNIHTSDILQLDLDLLWDDGGRACTPSATHARQLDLKLLD